MNIERAHRAWLAGTVVMIAVGLVTDLYLLTGVGFVAFSLGLVVPLVIDQLQRWSR